MMKKFLGVLNKSGQVESTISPRPLPIEDEELMVNVPPVGLFIDNEVPKFSEQIVPEEQNRMIVFLNRNYHAIGAKDGFEYHSNDILDTGKKKIRAQFQLIIDQLIQEKSAARLQMRNLIVDVSKISDETRQKLENTVEELNCSIEQLQKQKDLSSDGEGWVMNAIHSYHEGFIQGLNDYISGEQLLKSIKNI